MMRDFKFLRRSSANNPNHEEIENVPINPTDSSAPQYTGDSSRPPLNAIQEPKRNPKADKTPTKTKPRYSDGGIHHRTPEKRGIPANHRFGWSQKNDSTSNGVESRDEGKIGNLYTPRSNRGTVKANSCYSESNSTQCTPTKSISKPPNPGLCLTGGSRHPPASGGARMPNFTALSKAIPISSSSMTVVNTVEVPHFDLKEDPSFWMDHNIQVLIRIRPLNSNERNTNGYSRCLKQENTQCVWVGHPDNRFTFDHVACETVDQETLFKMVGLPMVENCLSGYNSCMFAYGQTGSGKTYTMLGEIDELEVRPSPHRGMTPRLFEFLFARIRKEEENRRDESLKYYCKCSFLEIYNEQITDLLDPSSTNLLLREDSKKGVYVENLSEFEVGTVGDILRLLSQGSSNRKVAATNMNRESSRSHSVFTCIIESRWEKDSTSNLRFARLNLVDLAGSERQKTSGAEGERLKEAANINKSLSTLGYVIMALVDVSNAKQRHIPYRDSRLTFLLQDSLGGNSKTMIIANVSPSICSAAETLNTLKFAQRAKLIQNNAVVNEDTSGDVTALQHQIRLLKEEICALKRQNVSRSLSFGATMNESSWHEGERTDDIPGTLRLSSKQLKSLEYTLTGALRREQMAETSIKQVEVELEQSSRLVQLREEDSRCSKMMLKFREEKIQRMESLVNGLLSEDSYLQAENKALSEEINLLNAKLDRNPEVTRFALENIRLLDQLRRFQDFYEEGEREILLHEVSELRDQLANFLSGNSKQHDSLNIEVPPMDAVLTDKENEYLHLELKKTLDELEECRNKLNSCLENNAKLSREIDDLHATIHNISSGTPYYDGSIEVIKESILEAPLFNNLSFEAIQKVQEKNLTKHIDEQMNLQLELDILKVITEEERSARGVTEEKLACLMKNLESAEGNLLSLKKNYEDVNSELIEAKSIIEALESQQLISIDEIEELRSKYEIQDSPSEDSPLQMKLRKMQDSLEKAKALNVRYQRDKTFNASNEEEMDEVRKQVEAETAEVIVCLQEELSVLQDQVHESKSKEKESEAKILFMQNELDKLKEELESMKIGKEDFVIESKSKEKESEAKILFVQNEMDKLKDELESMKVGKEDHVMRSNLKEKESEVKILFMQNEMDELRDELESVKRGKEDHVVKSNLKEKESEAKILFMQNEIDELKDELVYMKRGKQDHVVESNLKEKESKAKILFMQNEIHKLKDELDSMKRVNEDHVRESNLKEKESQAKIMFKKIEIEDLKDELDSMKRSNEDQIIESNLKEKESEQKIMFMQNEIDELKDKLDSMKKSYEGRAHESNLKDRESEEKIIFRKEIDELKEELDSMKRGNEVLIEELEVKEKAYKLLSDNVELLTSEIEVVDEVLKDASNEKINSVSEKFSRIARRVSEKEFIIEELRQCLEAANGKRVDLESMLMSLRGAVLVITETHQQDCKQKEDVILYLTSQLSELKIKTIILEEEKKEVSNCATAAFVIVNRLSELNSELQEMNLQKDEICSKLKVQLEEIEGNNIFNAKEQITLLKTGITNLESQFESPERDFAAESLKMRVLLQTGKGENLLIKDVDSKILEESRALKGLNNKESTIDLVKKETESALESLRGVQLEISKLRDEKEQISESEEHSRQTLTSIISLLLALQATMDNFKEKSECKMVLLDGKLRKVEGITQESADLWFQEKKFYELELDAAQILAAEKTAESCCFLAKLKEAQETMKEADCVINKLMISNETMKIEIQQLKKKETDDAIIKDQHIQTLENHYETEITEMKTLILELEDTVSQIQTTFDHDFLSLSSDFLNMKSQLQESNYIIHNGLEEIWSEIIVKDSALSVLHLCHMGILLETVTGLNLENGFLINGICESNSLITELREHNCKSRKELEICRILEEKLLNDIKNSFDRISKKDAETGEFLVNLTNFETKILDLEVQEESMLKRSNYMASELNLLMKEFNLSNKNLMVSVLDQESLLKEKEEQFATELFEKDLELFVLVKAFEQLAAHNADMVKNQTYFQTMFEEIKKYSVLLKFDVEVKDLILLENESEFSDMGKSYEEFKQLIEDAKMKELALQNEISLLGASLTKLLKDLEIKDLSLAKMNSLEENYGLLERKLRDLEADRCKSLQDLEEKKADHFAMQKEIISLKNSIANLQSHQAVLQEDLLAKIHNLEILADKVLNKESFAAEKMLVEMHESLGTTSKLIQEVDCLGNLSEEITGENFSLRIELGRKEKDLEDLLLDLSLLQEFEYRALILESQLQEKIGEISTLELDLSKERDTVNALTGKNLEYIADIEQSLNAKKSIEKDLQKELESSKSKVECFARERDELYAEIFILKNELETVQALAQENGTMAMEAQEGAETAKQYADDKEEEVKLLERSIEELERTLDVLESKADIIKGEAERQRLQREDLELELQAVKKQLLNVESNSDDEIQRHLEKEKNLQESLNRIQILERELTAKDAEMAQFKSHIAELNLHAEAQACEYKQKFKALETMADQVKPEMPSVQTSNLTSNKLERTGSKSRGSGSPFKCIGLGIAQQIKSERDEEFRSGKQRVEELEALAANRQKEIFMLNARLATAESMTHDVIRDLLGLKLDMTNYASLLDNQQVQKLTEKAKLHTAEAQNKDDDVVKLKLQLNVFVEERKGWLEEIERKQADMVSAQIALEQSRERDRSLTAKNELLKTENNHHKKRVMELETELKKLSGQQNLQQRIHHHAKIKEENNLLMAQNEVLSLKLRRTDGILLRIRQELANYRTANGKSPFINFDEEQRLKVQFEESEGERLQLAQKLVGLCTSILKAAGVTRPASEINVSIAEESLDKLKNQIESLQRELKETKLENRISHERSRLSEIKPKSSAKSADENTTPNIPFRSTLER